VINIQSFYGDNESSSGPMVTAASRQEHDDRRFKPRRTVEKGETSAAIILDFAPQRRPAIWRKPSL